MILLERLSRKHRPIEPARTPELTAYRVLLEVERYRAGTNLVLLEPAVAQAFPTDASVNEALQ